jgi:hypothetical protein
MAVLFAGDNSTSVHARESLVHDLEVKVLGHEIVEIHESELNQF